MGRDRLSRSRTVLVVAGTSLLTLALDQVTKALVRSSMEVGQRIPLITDAVNLTYVRNEGAAFGLMPGRRWAFVAVALLMLAGVSVYVVKSRALPAWTAVALGLVAAGAVGNLIDRLVSGRVTDFFDVGFWPVFNVADSAVVVGVTLLVARILLTPPAEE